MFSSVGACTNIMETLLGDNVSAPAFHTMGLEFDVAVRVQ